MKDKKKFFFNLFVFTFLIFLTYYIIFKDYDMKYVIQNIENLDIFYLFIAFILMTIYFVLESLNIRFILKTFKEKISILKTFRYILVCFFFSAITPGGSGGQPVAIYYLSKEKVNVSHSAMAFLIELFGYNCSKVLLGFVSYFILPAEVQSDLRIFFIIGFLFSLVPITITFVGIFKKELSNKLVKGFLKLLKKLKVKNIEEKEKKALDELRIFDESSSYVKTHKKEVAKSMILSLMQVIVFYMIPFFVYKSLHQTGVTIITFILLQGLLHCSSSSIPLPGAVGITETVFLIIYGYIYATADLLQSSLIVSRLVTFYVFVVISLIVYIFTLIKIDKKS